MDDDLKSINSEEMMTRREAAKQEVQEEESEEEEEVPKPSPEELKKEEEKQTQLANSNDAKIKSEVDKMIEQNNSGNFFKRLLPYNQPIGLVYLGFGFASVAGCIFPSFGVFITKSMFSMMIPDKELMWEEANKWNLIMILASVGAFFIYFASQYLFKSLGENITLNIRKSLYNSLLHKDAGFFDERDNQAGVLTTTLASDVQKLNGASTEGTAVIIETSVAMLCGLAICFAFDWKISLVAFALSPLMVFGNYVNAQQQQGMSEFDDVASKEANILAGDAITNYRTVMSFGNDDMLIRKFDELLMESHNNACRKAHFIGFMYGFSQFAQQALFSCLYYSMARFNLNGTSNPQDQFTAIFSIFYGAAAAGNAQQFGPDVGKAKQAGTKIFNIIDTPSMTKLHDMDRSNNQLVKVGEMKGKIEFRNVWFRYPTRKEQWIFKGLNLTINPNESMAIVGESGSGKSTFVNLLLRFYDPDAGEVLVDDVNIKNYDLHEYRLKLGLVMQEPTLFNYSIKENILYGQSYAKNSQIIDSAKIANATDFIENTQLMDDIVDDSPAGLIHSYEELKSQIVARIGAEKYEKHMQSLLKIQIKLRKQGQFEYEKDIFDFRSSQERDVQLHQGYLTNCGIRGSKLSGGQKQRIAIARAVIRQPSILLLDEATSALDEDSQRKVQKALENIMVGRTSIVIAHRLSTVEKCDIISCLENGVITEKGSYPKLMKKRNGFFSNLAKGLAQSPEKQASPKKLSSPERRTADLTDGKVKEPETDIKDLETGFKLKKQFD
uniref:Uncharacterized protein n=1 Tax=Strombidium rassoulzadegani TaxID=1082188 RepID=A0A7S3CHM5_9SPIT|mmetsp:Transcript_10620/g.17841  ORF Transcript_10620/g.17841 Transcript_10620/m.17841 type:complete len:780 (+) Transcript_10620:965-3304(+)